MNSTRPHNNVLPKASAGCEMVLRKSSSMGMSPIQRSSSGPGGHPFSVKAAVDDLLQTGQVQDHDQSAPWFGGKHEAGYQVNVKDSLQQAKPSSGLLMIRTAERNGRSYPAPSLLAGCPA